MSSRSTPFSLMVFCLSVVSSISHPQERLNHWLTREGKTLPRFPENTGDQEGLVSHDDTFQTFAELSDYLNQQLPGYEDINDLGNTEFYEDPPTTKPISSFREPRVTTPLPLQVTTRPHDLPPGPQPYESPSPPTEPPQEVLPEPTTMITLSQMPAQPSSQPDPPAFTSSPKQVPARSEARRRIPNRVSQRLNRRVPGRLQTRKLPKPITPSVDDVASTQPPTESTEPVTSYAVTIRPAKPHEVQPTAVRWSPTRSPRSTVASEAMTKSSQKFHVNPTFDIPSSAPPTFSEEYDFSSKRFPSIFDVFPNIEDDFSGWQDPFTPEKPRRPSTSEDLLQNHRLTADGDTPPESSVTSDGYEDYEQPSYQNSKLNYPISEQIQYDNEYYHNSNPQYESDEQRLPQQRPALAPSSDTSYVPRQPNAPSSYAKQPEEIVVAVNGNDGSQPNYYPQDEGIILVSPIVTTQQQPRRPPQGIRKRPSRPRPKRPRKPSNRHRGQKPFGPSATRAVGNHQGTSVGVWTLEEVVEANHRAREQQRPRMSPRRPSKRKRNNPNHRRVKRPQRPRPAVAGALGLSGPIRARKGPKRPRRPSLQ